VPGESADFPAECWRVGEIEDFLRPTRGTVVAKTHRGGSMPSSSRKALLLCGLVSSLLYAAMNAFIPMMWDGYRSFSQTISELSAVDAPTRAVWVPLGFAYTVLVAAFGIGVRASADHNRALQVLGALLIFNGLFGLGWLPMHQRAVLVAGGATLTDTMHLVWGAVTSVLLLFEIGFGAAAFGRRFRIYSIATMTTLLFFGLLTFRDAPSVAANLPTPWLGVWERINVLGYMLWQAVLSVTLLRGQEAVRSQTSINPVHSHFFSPTSVNEGGALRVPRL